MRLDKLLEIENIGSKKQVRRLLASKQVRIDGQIVQDFAQNVEPAFQTIEVAGRRLEGQAGSYFLLHKPAGVVTAVRDKKHQTVLDLIDEEDRVPGLYPIGRLDRDTEGLVLITDNGPLGFRLLHPKHHVTKVYTVTVNGPLSADAPAFFENGVRFLDGTVCKPAQLTIVESGPAESSAMIELSEGKFHQVKKMFLAYGVKVTSLKRIQFGAFTLGDLSAGQYRRLTEGEKQLLKQYLD